MACADRVYRNARLLKRKVKITMSEPTTSEKGTASPEGDTIEALQRRIGRLDPRQIAAWQAMAPARRLEIAFQAYQFALEAVRLTERRARPDLSPEELAWRVTRRMQGDPRLGR